MTRRLKVLRQWSKKWEVPATLLLAAAALLLSSVITGVQILLAKRANQILAAQNDLIRAQNLMTETQAAASIVSGLDLERPAGNQLKIGLLTNFERPGHEALLNLVEGGSVKERSARTEIRRQALEALFSQGLRHDAQQVAETLDAWCRGIDPGYIFPPGQYYGIEYKLEDARELAKPLGASAEYFEALRWRITYRELKSPLAQELRKKLGASPWLVRGLAALHYAVLKYRDELYADYREDVFRDVPLEDRKNLILEPAPYILWHIRLYDFAMALRGDVSHEVYAIGSDRHWNDFANVITSCSEKLVNPPDCPTYLQKRLTEEIRKWFQYEEPHQKKALEPPRTPSPKPAPTTTPRPA